MDYQDSLLIIRSRYGKGSSISDLTYNIKYLKTLQKEYDIQIGLKSFHLNDILFEIIVGQNNIQWYEIKYPLPGDIRISNAVLTPGFYTKSQLILLLETEMKNNSQHGITYFVSFNSENRIIITTNKAPTDKQFLINNTGVNSAWSLLGFEVGLQTTYVTTLTGEFRIFYDDNVKIDIYTNLIKSSTYSVCENTTTNQIIADLDITSPGETRDYFHFYDNFPTFFEASDLNGSSIYIKMYNCLTEKLHDFRVGASYEISFIIRHKFKASIIRKSMTITKTEIVGIVQELLKEKAKNNKKTIEKKLKDKKPDLPKKK